jgi:urease accessory protein
MGLIVTDLAIQKSKLVNRQTPLNLAKVGHWQGDLHLRYALSPDSAKTIIAERQHQGPYTVQRPFYPEGDVCHSILLHPPGGLVEGDALSLSVECDSGAHCFITTPSAGKAYECSTDFAMQKQRFHIQNQAKLEWFPQEMILYNNSKSDLQTDIHLFGNGQFVGWEMVCFGRPIAGDHFSGGELKQLISLSRDGKPILLERTMLQAEHLMRKSAYGFANYQAMGVFLMTGAQKHHLEQARAVIDSLDQPVREAIQIGFTLLGDVLVGRALMNQSRFAKTAFVAVWSTLREDILKTPAIMPRIWLT